MNESHAINAGVTPLAQTAPLSEAAPTPPTAHRTQHHPHHRGLLPAIQSLFYIIVIAIFIITFIVQPFRIPSASMEPTLLIGDFLLVAKHSIGFDEPTGILPASAIHRGEIIIFHFPVNPSIHLIKRVVGLPGDHIRLHDQHVYINGQPLTEPYAMYTPGRTDIFRDNFPRLQAADADINPAWWIRMHTLMDHGELIIPAGNYFVLGDNRNDSEDSRYWGLVPRSSIVGSPVFIYFSLRSPDPTDDPQSVPEPPPHQTFAAISNFARWHRIFHVVR